MSGQIQISQMVILAAGKGTRIRGRSQPLPKPLVRCGGLTLLKRTILTAKREGVQRFVIVVGCDGDQVRDAIQPDPELADLDLVFVTNEDYELSNGVSVLKAREHIRGEFFLTMSDHVVDPAIFRTLQSTPAHGGLVLAVDRKLSTIFDMDDATKVRVDERDRITDIGKHLTSYDAVDTGVFRCSPALFDALQHVLDETGDTSLSHGVTRLAERGRARTADVGAAWWQDVDDLSTRKHAEKLLFASLTKPIDGPVSKHLNRRFSKAVTRLLMNTNVVPNHMTVVGLVVGLAAAAVTAFATANTLWLFAVGGLLYQLSSMLDGCDGEIARLKYKHSDSGEWFDTVSDDVINLSYQLAIGFALFNITGQSLWLQAGLATFVLGWVLCFSVYRKLLANGRGTHLAIEWNFKDSNNKSLFLRFCARMEFLGHRDVYALLLMGLAFMGVAALKVALVLSLATVVVVGTCWIGTSLSQSSRRAAAGTR